MSIQLDRFQFLKTMNQSVKIQYTTAIINDLGSLSIFS